MVAWPADPAYARRDGQDIDQRMFHGLAETPGSLLRGSLRPVWTEGNHQIGSQQPGVKIDLAVREISSSMPASGEGLGQGGIQTPNNSDLLPAATSGPGRGQQSWRSRKSPRIDTGAVPSGQSLPSYAPFPNPLHMQIAADISGVTRRQTPGLRQLNFPAILTQLRGNEAAQERTRPLRQSQ